MNISIYKVPFPEDVHGGCMPDGDRDIIGLNENDPEEVQLVALFHEILHVWHRDFYKGGLVRDIEEERRAELLRILERAAAQ